MPVPIARLVRKLADRLKGLEDVPQDEENHYAISVVIDLTEARAIVNWAAANPTA